MPRLLPKEIKEEMISKLKKGVSINQISKEIGLAKSTIYHHYKKINGKKFVEPVFESNLSKEEGELLGIIIGDGSLLHYKEYGHYRIIVAFGKVNEKYARYVKNKFERFINKKLKIYSFREDGIRIQINSKKLYNHFKKYLDFEQNIKHSTVKIKELDKLPINFKIGILKGLIDTDGCVSKEKATGRYKVQYFSTSKDMCFQFKSIVEELGLNCGVYSIKPHEKTSPSGKKFISKEYYSTYLLKRDVLSLIDIVKPIKAKKYGLVV